MFFNCLSVVVSTALFATEFNELLEKAKAGDFQRYYHKLR